MIGRRRHPRKRSRHVFIPLRRNEHHTWVSLLGRGFREKAFQAAELCADDLARRYREFARHSRILRALCEHPEFEFIFAGIDSDTVREQAQRLDELIQAENENVAHLLDPPGQEHRIRIGGVRMRVTAEGLLEPRDGARGEESEALDGSEALDESEALDDSEARDEELGEKEPALWSSADELFAHLLDAALTTVEEEAGETISPQGVEDTIARLRALHSPHNDNGTADDDTAVTDEEDCI